MKRFSEQLHKQAQSLKLKKSEQADLRERLVSYMEYHPLPAEMKVAAPATKSTKSPILTESFAQYSIPFQSFFKYGSVAAVFVLLVVPFMAERSVPGDTLYAVKVQFNEEVRSSLTWDGYERVEWETERLNRRIAEARLLADEGLLTEEVEASVAAAVKEHSDSAKREIEELRASDADEAAIASIAFDSSLEVQAQALQSMDAIGGGEAAIADMTARSAISEVLDESLQKDETAGTSTLPAYEKLMVRVELNTTRVRELRDSLNGLVPEQELAGVTRRIEDIDRAIGEAVVLAQSEDTEAEAQTALVDVLARTQKLIVFMTDLKVREDVAIEAVVPVVPTDDEMAIDRSSRTEQLATYISQLQAIIANKETQEALIEKLSDTLTKLEAAQASLGEVVDYNAFTVESDVALQLASDALRLVEMEGVTVPVVVSETETATSSDELPTEETATSTDEILDEEVTEETESNETEEVASTPDQEPVVEEEDSASSTPAQIDVDSSEA